MTFPRILCLCISVVLSGTNCIVTARGTDPVREILLGAGDAAVVIDYGFNCTVRGGQSVRGSGSLSSQRGMYRLENGPYTVIDDGREMLVMNRNTKEAVRQKSSFAGAAADTPSLLRLFGFNPKGALTSRSTDARGTVRGIEVMLSDGTEISVTLKSVKYPGVMSSDIFSPETSSLDRAWTVTDLR